jgi:hypothetical protein
VLSGREKDNYLFKKLGEDGVRGKDMINGILDLFRVFRKVKVCAFVFHLL